MTQVVPISGKIVREENNNLISIFEACERIFFADDIFGKITFFSNVDFENYTKPFSFDKQKTVIPSRPSNLLFSSEKIKFPKDAAFKFLEGRAKALHAFANHELLAIEVMAWMILTLPHDPVTLHHKKEIWKTLLDEQRHLVLYMNRLGEMNIEFGDFPVNDFFWKIFSTVSNLKQYFSLMALTFESANLDFSHFYAKVFESVGDFSSAQVMKIIFQDEIHHVHLGVKYMYRVEQPEVLWNNYLNSLPWPITPARAKGINYQEQHRIQAGLPPEFIHQLSNFQDSFKVTDRRR